MSKGNTIKVDITYSSSNGGTSYTINGGNENLGGFEYTYQSTTGSLDWHPHKP